MMFFFLFIENLLGQAVDGTLTPHRDQLHAGWGAAFRDVALFVLGDEAVAAGLAADVAFFGTRKANLPAAPVSGVTLGHFCL
jgi:hypothetical protein